MESLNERFEKGQTMRSLMAQGDPSHYTLPGIDQLAPDLKRIINEALFGQIWTRPGLDRKTRSMLNLAILTTLGKMTELKGHTRGAIENGCTKEEIMEVLLHTTIYAGVPAGVDAFRNAKEALEALE